MSRTCKFILEPRCCGRSSTQSSHYFGVLLRSLKFRETIDRIYSEVHKRRNRKLVEGPSSVSTEVEANIYARVIDVGRKIGYLRLTGEWVEA